MNKNLIVKPRTNKSIMTVLRYDHNSRRYIGGVYTMLGLWPWSHSCDLARVTQTWDWWGPDTNILATCHIWHTHTAAAQHKWNVLKISILMEKYKKNLFLVQLWSQLYEVLVGWLLMLVHMGQRPDKKFSIHFCPVLYEEDGVHLIANTFCL